MPGPWPERLGERAGESALQVRRVEEGLTGGTVLLAVLLPRQHGGREGLVDVADGALGGCLLDERAPELEVIHDCLLKRLVQRPGIRWGRHASLLQQRAQLRGDGRLEGLAAGDEREGTREGGYHEVRSLAESRGVGLDGEILQHQLARRHARDGDGTLDNRGDNLAHRGGERDGEEPREGQSGVLREVGRGRDLDVLLHGGGDAAGHVRAHLPAVALAHSAHTAAKGTAAAGGHAHAAHAGLVGHPARAAHDARHGGGRRGGGVFVGDEIGVADALALNLVEELRRLDRLDVHLEVLEEPLHLELEVELEVSLAVNLLEEREHRGGPRVGRLEDDRIFGGFENLGDERDDGDHVPSLVGLQDETLEIEVVHEHGLVTRVRELTEPGSEVLEQRSLAAVGLDLVGAQQRLDVAVGGVQDAPDQLRFLQRAEQTEVQRVKVGLDGRALHHEVHGEPRPVIAADSRLDLGGFLLQVLHREVVDDEVNLVDDVGVGDDDVLVAPRALQSLEVERGGEPGPAGGRRARAQVALGPAAAEQPRGRRRLGREEARAARLAHDGHRVRPHRDTREERLVRGGRAGGNRRPRRRRRGLAVAAEVEPRETAGEVAR